MCVFVFFFFFFFFWGGGALYKFTHDKVTVWILTANYSYVSGQQLLGVGETPHTQYMECKKVKLV